MFSWIKKLINKIKSDIAYIKKLKELAQGKKMPFIILNKDFEFKCFFEPDNQVSGDDIYNFRIIGTQRVAEPAVHELLPLCIPDVDT